MIPIKMERGLALRATRWRKAVESAIPYILGAGSLVCAAVIGNFLRHDKDKTNGAYIAGLASAVVTFLGAVYARYSEIKADKQAETLLALQAENKGLIEKLGMTLTGGNSFAAVYYPVVEGKRVMTIRHFGIEPLTNIRISVIAGMPPKPIDGLIYPSLPPKAIEKIKPVTFNVHHRIAMQISFETLNKSWHETVVCSDVDGELLFALNVWRLQWNEDGTGKRDILFEEVHPRYPRGDDGNVDWSLGMVDISGSTLSTETPEETLSRQLQMRDPLPRIGIGGRVTSPPLPHHRTSGSASGGSRS
jgi:hypothetical protein